MFSCQAALKDLQQTLDIGKATEATQHVLCCGDNSSIQLQGPFERQRLST